MTDTRQASGMEGETLAEPKTMTAAEEAWDVAKTVLIAVAVTMTIRFFLVQPFNIPSGSMKPTLLVGDFILVDKIDYGYSKASLIYPLSRLPLEGRLFGDDPERGEIIVFKNTNDRNHDYIKRLIGMPGDRIQMIAGSLYLNGQIVPREALPEGTAQCSNGRMGVAYRETLPDGPTYTVQECDGDDADLDNTRTYRVPEGHYFFMGDNRDNSLDSRTSTVQFVPKDQLVGRATRIAFSVDGERSRIWQVWNWFRAIRYGRLFSAVE